MADNTDLLAQLATCPFILQFPEFLPRLEPNLEWNSSTPISGKIGKLRVYRSGRMELAIGNILFNVERGSPVYFLQKIATVSQKDQQIAMLGNTRNKLVLKPVLH